MSEWVFVHGCMHRQMDGRTEGRVAGWLAGWGMFGVRQVGGHL